MRERGIIFSAPMVRALLAGRKTVTRRLVKLSHPPYEAVYPHPGGGWIFVDRPLVGDAEKVRRQVERLAVGREGKTCPHGKPGDRLWVREAFRLGGGDSLRGAGGQPRYAPDNVHYRADPDEPPDDRWYPSILMPRWASRVTLELVDVRPERLQDITDEDVRREGAVERTGADAGLNQGLLLSATNGQWYGPNGHPARDLFADGWDALHGRWSWWSNPWVWRVEFRRVER